MKTAILYEDQDILVCYKPAGFAVQSARASQMDMESELRSYLHGGGLYVIHRLDQPVEGILVFAKNREAAAGLGAQMRDGVMNKYYRALVCGKMPATGGELINDMIKKENGVAEIVTIKADMAANENGGINDAGEDSRLSGRKAEGTPQKSGCGTEAKRAELSYRVEAYDPDADVSDVRICLRTGRFHQIRLQFSHAGHPIAGDRKYGGETARRAAESLGLKYVALCAERLCFIHPKSGKELDFSTTPEFHKK